MSLNSLLLYCWCILHLTFPAAAALNTAAAPSLQVPQLQHVLAAALSHSHHSRSQHSRIVNALDASINIQSLADNLHQFQQRLQLKGLSDECFNTSIDYLKAIVSAQPWAMQTLDAYGKVGSGVSEGNFMWLGSYDLCANISVPLTGWHLTANTLFGTGTQYCLLTIGRADVVNASAAGGVVAAGMYSGAEVLRTGVCIPAQCDQAEVQGILDTGFTLVNELFPLSGYNMSLGAVASCQGVIPFEWRAVLALCCIVALVLLVTCGTFYDVWVTAPAMKELVINADRLLEEQTIQQAQQQYLDRNNAAVKVALCFSLTSNCSRLFYVPHSASSSGGTLSTLHGIRFISMTWIILGHTYAFLPIVQRNILAELDMVKSFTFQAISNGTFSVDSFYFISGLLTAYLFLREREQSGRVNLFVFYLHRFWRLTPVYMLVLMVYTCLFEHLSPSRTGGAPLWPAQGPELDHCRRTWWANLLYVNNFVTDMNIPATDGEHVPSVQMCMGWTWYLANDMQLHLISPIILYPLFRSSKVGISLIFLFLLAGTITTGVLAAINQYPANMMDVGIDMSKLMDYMDYLYFRPWPHVGPYVVGISIGYLLYRTRRRVTLNRKCVVLCWTLSVVCNTLVLYGLYPSIHRGQHMSTPLAALYISTSRTAWSMGLGWLTFACLTGYGGVVNRLLSWRVFVPLSRLTYPAYLVHPIIMYMYLLSRRQTVYFTTLDTVMLYLGFLTLSYAAAFLLSLCIESPVLQLEKLVLRRHAEHRERSKCDTE